MIFCVTGVGWVALSYVSANRSTAQLLGYIAVFIYSTLIAFFVTDVVKIILVWMVFNLIPWGYTKVYKVEDGSGKCHAKSIPLEAVGKTNLEQLSIARDTGHDQSLTDDHQSSSSRSIPMTSANASLDGNQSLNNSYGSLHDPDSSLHLELGYDPAIKAEYSDPVLVCESNAASQSTPNTSLSVPKLLPS